MAELQTISAVVGIMRNTWHAIEFIRSACNARREAVQLWERTNDLYLLVEKIDSVVRDHTDPLNEDVILIVRKALQASNRTLNELARRCLNLGDRDEIPFASQIGRSICFTLSLDSIQKFEQQLQTNIMSVQIAFYLLDRGESQELTRRVNDLLSTIETAVSYIAHHTSMTHRNRDALRHAGPSIAALETLDECIETANITIGKPSASSLSLPQTHQVQNDDAPDSPIQRLTSQETEAWAEIAQRPSRSIVRAERAESTGRIALIDAIVHHSRDEFQRLLDECTNINDTDEEGYTPLMYTITEHGKSCDECLWCMHMLLQVNVDVDASNNGETALHMSVKQDHLDAAIALLEQGANIDASSPNTPLMLAVQSNRPTFVELFLASVPKPNVNIVDHHDWNLVHHAVCGAGMDMLLVLLQSSESMGLGLDVDARCALDWTPLIHLAENAQRSNNAKKATTLLDYGADVNATDLEGHSALYYAVSMGVASPQRNDFVRLLLERGADVELVRSQVQKRVIDRYPALKRSVTSHRRDSVHSCSDASPVSRRGSSFKRRRSKT